MIVVDTAGLSSLWGVDLNAVSLINLVAVSQFETPCGKENEPGFFISYSQPHYKAKTHKRFERSDSRTEPQPVGKPGN